LKKKDDPVIGLITGVPGETVGFQSATEPG